MLAAFINSRRIKMFQITKIVQAKSFAVIDSAKLTLLARRTQTLFGDDATA